MSYLPPVDCRMAHVLFTSSCLQEGSCLIYLQLTVGWLMSYLLPAVCRRVHVLFTRICMILKENYIFRLIKLIYLCLFAHSGVQHILVPISPDCPFVIAPSVLSNVSLFTSPLSLKSLYQAGRCMVILLCAKGIDFHCIASSTCEDLYAMFWFLLAMTIQCIVV